jgi:hypothetical protein
MKAADGLLRCAAQVTRRSTTPPQTASLPHNFGASRRWQVTLRDHPPHRVLRAAVFGLLLASTALGQFALYVVDGNVEHPAPAVLDLGQVYPAEAASARFRLRNISNAPAAVGLLKVNGTGYSLSGAPALPTGLAPQQAIEFSVVFQATAAAGYSASLDTEGTSVLITTTVLARLTCQLDTGAGLKTLDASPVAFGTVEAGASTTRHFVISNLTGLVLPVPGIAVQGGGFALQGFPPSGNLLQPLDTAGFDVAFQPGGVGTFTGSLIVGDRTFALTGTSLAVPLPQPLLAIKLGQAASGQQGTVGVQLDTAARTTGSGTLTLDFQPLPKGATDGAIQLGTVGRSLPFTVGTGDTQVSFGDLTAVAFQTGTTAGTLTFTVELGGATDRKSITIDPAPVNIASATGTRGTGSIELKIAGFDNTRTAGPVTYTFFDAAGSPIPPGAIQVDNTADFAAYFATSDTAGAFGLRAVFPVTGDLTRIAAFEMQITNAAGTAKSGRQNF